MLVKWATGVYKLRVHVPCDNEMAFERNTMYTYCPPYLWIDVWLSRMKEAFSWCRWNLITYKPIASEVKWVECSLIIGMGCWVHILSLTLDSSDGLWVVIQSVGNLVSRTSQLRILLSAEEDNLSPSIRKPLACARTLKSKTTYR